jgi:beta-galactosidase
MAADGRNPSPHTVTVADHAFRVGGKATALYGGAVHYWRLDRDKWDGILDSVKAMGFNMVSIYIPWEIHEIERGRFDFSGNKDIDAFLTLVESKGLNIVARPGPQINAELTWFGYPGRILADPELQALNGQGTKAVLTQVPRPIPALSYAVDKFFDETALWYDAILPILARHLYPKGRLVAAQVDNEMAFFFHVNAYACDYHPASIARYQAFLVEKYGSLAALNTCYGSGYGTLAEIDPPRRFDAGATMKDVPYYSDWIAYRERYLVDSIDRLAGMMRARGIVGIPLFHNYPHPLGPGGAASGYTTPFDLMGLEEKVDFVGFDIYSRKELYEHVKTVGSYVVGTSRFPYIPEFIAGVWSWYLNPGDLYDEEFVTKAALMQGLKGFSRYVLVERDRWLDSPIRRDGRVREDHTAMFRRMNEIALERDFVDLRRQADVLLLANREYDRLEAASVLVSFPGDFLETPSGFSEYPSFMTVSESSLGFAEPIQVAKADRFNAAYQGLSDAGYPYLLSDTKLAPERWSRYKAVVVSSFEYMSAALQQSLLAYATAGGTVVLGPRLPTLDEAMRPDSTLAGACGGAGEPVLARGSTVGTSYAVGTGRIVLVPDLGDAGPTLDAALVDTGAVRFTRNDSRLDVTIHRVPGDASRVVIYVANPTADPIDAEVAIGQALGTVTELWTGQAVTPRGSTLAVAMPAYSIQIFECAL